MAHYWQFFSPEVSNPNISWRSLAAIPHRIIQFRLINGFSKKLLKNIIQHLIFHKFHVLCFQRWHVAFLNLLVFRSRPMFDRIIDKYFVVIDWDFYLLFLLIFLIHQFCITTQISVNYFLYKVPSRLGSIKVNNEWYFPCGSYLWAPTLQKKSFSRSKIRFFCRKKHVFLIIAHNFRTHWWTKKNSFPARTSQWTPGVSNTGHGDSCVCMANKALVVARRDTYVFVVTAWCTRFADWRFLAYFLFVL